jgi:hypothetical protein
MLADIREIASKQVTQLKHEPLAEARDSSAIESRIPQDRADESLDRLVWIVFGSGDFLNLDPRPWSGKGTPHPCGTIVIADDTSEVLGVYPHWEASSRECP